MTPRRARVLAAAALLVLDACACQGPSEPPATTSTTPSSTSLLPSSATTTTAPTGPPLPLPEGAAWERDFPDPFVTTIEGVHHAFATTTGLLQIQHLTSDNLTAWAGPTEVLPEMPPWAAPLSAWAPALLHVDDQNLLFFTALVTGTDRHCIGVAGADSPDGPFTATADEPLLCPEELGGAIDPSPFVDDDDTMYLLWKNDGVTLRRDSAIWSQRLSEDGRSLLGEPTELIATDQDWEFPHVEAPSMVRVGDTFWLAYSGNWWNQPAYGIGLARCDSPTGPCEKPFDQPVITSRPQAEGPGGAEFFRDRTGKLQIAYHAWLGTPGYPGHRALHVQPVTVDGQSIHLGQ